MTWLWLFGLLPLILLFYAVRQLVKDRQGKKKKAALAQAYERVVQQNKAVIEQAEVVGNRVLALDRKNRKLIVVDHSGSEKQELCLSLVLIGPSRVVEERSESGNIERLWLELQPKTGNATYRICFFHPLHDRVTILPNRSRRILYWKSRIDRLKYPGTVPFGGEPVL